MALQSEIIGPSISIAIPVYNQASTIASTIESALKATQGLSGTEIVVSENHSNDGGRVPLRGVKPEARMP